MLKINNGEKIILTLKGMEQFYYQKDVLPSHETWLLEIIYAEHNADNIIKILIQQQAPPKTLFDLHAKNYIFIVADEVLETEKNQINAMFLDLQTGSPDGIEGQKLEVSAKFEEFDFARGEKKTDNYIDNIDVSDITIMPYGSDAESLYSTNSNPSSGVSETRGGTKISTKTPEVKAFEEIKGLLSVCIKEVFTIKSYVYSYQLSRVQNRAELNEFYQKIHLKFLALKGEEYVEDLIQKITAINTNYFIKNNP